MYDREWRNDIEAVNPNSTFAISTNTVVDVQTSGGNVPELVMQSADSCPQGQALNLTTSYISPSMSNPMYYYVSFYFAEIDPVALNETRVFDMILNQNVVALDISVMSPSSGMYNTTEMVFVGFNSTVTIQLVPHPDSQLGPILNALELFVVISALPERNPTSVSDGNHLTYISSPPLLLKFLIKSTAFEFRQLYHKSRCRFMRFLINLSIGLPVLIH